MTTIPRQMAALAERWSAGLSLGLAAAMGGLLAVSPQVRADDAGVVERFGLALVLLAAAAALIHGLGLRPDRRLLQLYASPRFAWPAAAVGAVILLVS